MGTKNIKTTTYSLDWDVVTGLESRLLRDFQISKSKSKGIHLLMVSIGSRLGLRVIDNLKLKWSDIISVQVGEKFVRLEQKTGKERILVMSLKLKQVINCVFDTIKPDISEYIFTSQKSKGLNHMTIQCFNRILKIIMKEYKIKYIGNCSSHLLRKSFVVGAIKKGFESGDHLSLVKVSRLIGHSNVSTTIRYTNFETTQMLDLYDLN